MKILAKLKAAIAYCVKPNVYYVSRENDPYFAAARGEAAAVEEANRLFDERERAETAKRNASSPGS